MQAFYSDILNVTSHQGRQKAPPSIDLKGQTISTIMEAHYGYVEYSDDEKWPTILLVLPNDVTEILGKITTQLPIDFASPQQPLSPLRNKSIR